jgi:hypothetical protein
MPGRQTAVGPDDIGELGVGMDDLPPQPTQRRPLMPRQQNEDERDPRQMSLINDVASLDCGSGSPCNCALCRIPQRSRTARRWKRGAR